MHRYFFKICTHSYWNVISCSIKSKNREPKICCNSKSKKTDLFVFLSIKFALVSNPESWSYTKGPQHYNMLTFKAHLIISHINLMKYFFMAIMLLVNYLNTNCSTCRSTFSILYSENAYFLFLMMLFYIANRCGQIKKGVVYQF